MSSVDNALVKTMLDQMEQACGTPYAYYEFEKAPGAAAYLAYYETEPDNFAADGVVYHSERHFTIELYTPTYNPVMEQTLTGIFDAHKVFWRRGSQAKIDAENMFQTVFYI